MIEIQIMAILLIIGLLITTLTLVKMYLNIDITRLLLQIKYKQSVNKLTKRISSSRELLKNKRQVIYEFRKLQRCSTCGAKNVKVLDFHHINPKNKNFQLSNISADISYTSIVKELSQCVVLCKNCHAIIHQETDTSELIYYYKRFSPIDTSFFNKFMEYDK